MTNPAQKRMGVNRCPLDGVHFNVRLHSPDEGRPGLRPKRANERPRSLPRSRKGFLTKPRLADFNPRAQWCLELAKLHTALAHVAATALTSDGRESVEVAGRRFCDMGLVLQEQGTT
jgi:hypothetical protein